MSYYIQISYFILFIIQFLKIMISSFAYTYVTNIIILYTSLNDLPVNLNDNIIFSVTLLKRIDKITIFKIPHTYFTIFKDLI